MHHIPNIICIIRIILIFPITYYLHNDEWLGAFVLFFIAGISDGIDGYLARKFSWQSKLGSILDPLADKLLMLVLYVMLAYKGIIPEWLALLVVARDIIIILGAMIYHWLTRELTISPLISSKINTAFQITFVIALMFHRAITPLSETLIYLLQLGVIFTTVYSGISYIIRGTQDTLKYQSENNKNKNKNGED